jgi:hypothetical protein
MLLGRASSLRSLLSAPESRALGSAHLEGVLGCVAELLNEGFVQVGFELIEHARMFLASLAFCELEPFTHAPFTCLAETRNANSAHSKPLFAACLASAKATDLGRSPGRVLRLARASHRVNTALAEPDRESWLVVACIGCRLLQASGGQP